MKGIKIREGCIDDASACALISNSWIDETPWMPRLHTPQDIERHYRETVFQEHQIFVAEIDDHLHGFVNPWENKVITALYVDRAKRGSGVEKALLDHAKKSVAAGKIELWAMQANLDAQRFYLREGFIGVRRTDGDNEEKLPDILYGWQAEATS